MQQAGLEPSSLLQLYHHMDIYLFWGSLENISQKLFKKSWLESLGLISQSSEDPGRDAGCSREGSFNDRL